MKNTIAYLTFSLLFVINSITTVHGEIANHLFSTKSVSFKGTDNNWEIFHEMTLVGTDILFKTTIKYKGKYDKDLNKSNSHYLVSCNEKTIGGETFLLNQSGEFHGKKRECGGCEFIDKVKEIKYEIYWKDTISTVILKKVVKD
ncbi:hypothetical protein RAH41_22305 [Gottfriedia acidiceleris]|uniref:hypothetical protein n=1 Tax=Gottfriedia acidiceleris TaxID=371036 RepID=UPI002F260117